MATFKNNRIDVVVVGLVLAAAWFGWFKLSTIGILLILFVMYWFFEKGPDKGFIQKPRK